jgi:hypothetical protein
LAFADSMYCRALAASPGGACAGALRARARLFHSRLGDLPAAARALEAALDAEPAHAKALARLGAVLFDGRYDPRLGEHEHQATERAEALLEQAPPRAPRHAPRVLDRLAVHRTWWPCPVSFWLWCSR